MTPEGVDLRLELATAGARAAAFLLDALIMLVVLIILSIALLLLVTATRSEMLMVVWLIGFFALRNGWFSLFEMGGRGATPGKRMMGIRVVARDGARLTTASVVARNAMREIEVFLPLSFLGAQAAQGTADTLLTLFALSWSGIFLFFPLFNRDRLRVGDLVAGTWVVLAGSSRLSDDLVGALARQRRSFPDSALGLYGVYELQTLEDVLRVARPAAISAVAQTIRTKSGLADDGDDQGFLSDYYAALCARLEAGLEMGSRRETKWDGGA